MRDHLVQASANRETDEAVLRDKGIDPHPTPRKPPSDAELINNFWFSYGYEAAFRDLLEEMES